MKSLFILLLALVCVAFVTAKLSQSEIEFGEMFIKHQFPEPSREQRNISIAESIPMPKDTQLELQGTFSLTDAQVASRLAAAAYCSPLAVKGTSTKLKTWTCQQCIDSGITLTNVTPFHVAIADFYGYVGYHAPSNSVHVVFQGSNNLVNWLYNLDAAFIDFPGVQGAQIHKGFYNMWVYSRPTVLALVDAQLYNKPAGVKVSLTGHSLGGAIAAVATLDLKTANNGYKFYNVHGLDVVVGDNAFDDANIPFDLKQFPMKALLQPTKVGGNSYTVSPIGYTFGQPRVGNTAWSNHFTSKVGNTSFVRVVHNQDIVPHVPPLLLWPTALHPYYEAFYKVASPTAADFTLCSNQPESNQCSNQFALPTSMNDHLNYMGYHVGSNPGAC